MSAFVIALSIPLLPVFGAIKLGEAAIKSKKNNTTLKEELENILNENDSDLIEKFHTDTKIIFKQEIENFLDELVKSNITREKINLIKKNLSEIINEWDKILEIKLLKKDKIITVYDITLSELQALSEEMILKLKDKINEIKTDVIYEKSKTINLKKEKTLYKKENKTHNSNQNKEKLFYYYNELIRINPDLQDKYKFLISDLKDYSSQRAKLLIEEIKLIYAKNKRILIKTQIYKEELYKLYSKTSNPKLKNKLENLIKQKTFTKKEYENLYMTVTKDILLNESLEKQKSSLVRSISKLLKDTNYVIINNEEDFINRLSNSKRIIVPVKDDDYKVVIQINDNNEILTRFVKIIDDKKNISTSEKLKDKSELKKWCSIQKKVYEELSKNFHISTKIIEDDESDILYIIDNKELHNTSKRKTNGQNIFRK